MILRLNKTTQSEFMLKTCNLSTVKNTPSEARRSTSTSECYYIKTIQTPDADSDMQYKSVQSIIDMIYDVLEYSDLSVLDDAVVFGYNADGTNRPLFMFKNDVVEYSFRIIKFNR